MRKITKKTKVAVGMSGGVDSSVTAALLKEQGFDLTGVHLECWSEPGCRAPEDRKDALAVAMQLGIPFKVLDFQKQYKKKVIDYFYAEYKTGRTPNPDVMCNKEIKFGLFYKWALKSGFDFVATGHYARIQKIPKSKFQMTNKAQNSKFKISNKRKKGGVVYRLLRGVDKKKDQSYFLYQLREEQLKHVMFPIGEMTKSQVRANAKKLGLITADKPDSQGICFLGDIDTQEFLRRKIKEKRGEVVIRINSKFQNPNDKSNPNYKLQVTNSKQISNSKFQNSKQIRRSGKTNSKNQNSKFEILDSSDYEVIGEHKGVWFYTIGQRRGFKIMNYELGIRNYGNKNKRPPLYVVGKDVVRNRLIVGTGKETTVDSFGVSDVHWIGREGIGSSAERIGNMKVRIRHGGRLVNAEVRSKNLESSNKKENLLVKLAKPQRGIAPGQSAVFYKGDECLGGGVIC